MALLAAACAASNGDPSAEPVPTSALAPSADVVRAAASDDAPTRELTTGFNDAGFELLRRLPVSDNAVLSPISIGHALLMARDAGDDPTRTAVDSAFALPTGATAHEAWNAIDQGIAASAAMHDDVIVTISDRIWPDLTTSPDQRWLDTLAAFHGVQIQPLDLKGDSEGSRQVINDAVADDTRDLIPELVPEGVIDSMTVLVLTDAVYFEAPWETPFAKYTASPGPFTLLDGSEVETEYLRELELSDRRGTGDGFVGAEIPYASTDFSMLVIVPDEGDFEAVRARLGQDLIDDIDATFTTGPFELRMPTWADTVNLDLIGWLSDNGIAPGSFPGIGQGVFLDAAVHAADIAVDEWGTVAAAATGLFFQESGPPEPELTVAADQPFFYLIRHRPTGAVLFAGQVTDPTR